jgi:uncharacterized protein with HEPN domain
MKKSPALHLQDILTSLELIPGFLEGYDKARFVEDVKTQFAVIRAMGIMGDAVKKLPDEYLARHPDIPWREMAKTRDVLIHDYYKVDLDILWDVITDKLPPLVGRLRELLDEAR